MPFNIGTFFSWPCLSREVEHDTVGLAPLARALFDETGHSAGSASPRGLGYLADQLAELLPAEASTIADREAPGGVDALTGQLDSEDRHLHALIDARAQRLIDRALDAQARHTLVGA